MSWPGWRLEAGPSHPTQLDKYDKTTQDVLEGGTIGNKVYKTGDKLYKISYSYYGDTKYWWVIAWFNRKPTDFHCKIGDTIYVPFPLKQALYLANRD